MGVETHHLVRPRKHAKVAINWQALFGGERCLFSERFHRTLSIFGLHNMRGSDECMEMTVVGTIKGLAEKVEFPLSRETLINECPSHRTIARNKEKLAVGCYIRLCSSINEEVWCQVGSYDGCQQYTR